MNELIPTIMLTRPYKLTPFLTLVLFRHTSVEQVDVEGSYKAGSRYFLPLAP